jgi:transcriptional regulator GlxA family with amidase domain
MSQCLSTLPDINFRFLLNSLRVDHAKMLLVTTELKIIDVALESGFSNERTMQRAFRDILGMTPAEYRARKK